MWKRQATLVTYLGVLLQVFPAICNAGHYRWGWTDASVPESGAYLAAVILVPFFLLVFWIFLRAASQQAVSISRTGELVPVKELTDLSIIFHLGENTSPE